MLKTYRRMIKVVGSYHPQLKTALLLSVIASVLQGVIFALYFPLLSALLTRPIDGPQVWALLAWFGGLVIVEGLLRSKELDFGWITSIDVAHETRLRLGEQLRRMPLQELNRRRSGDLNVVMSGNVSEVVMWIGSLATLIIQTIVVPLVTVLVTLLVDWRLAVALLIAFPLTVPIYRAMRSLVQDSLREVAAADAETASRVVEYVQGLPVLRAAQQVGTRSQRLQAALDHQRTIQAKEQRLASLPLITMATLVEVGIIVVIGVGVLLILHSSLSVAALMALAVIAMRFTEPLTQLIGLFSILDLMEIALERIEAVMDILPLPVHSPPSHPTQFDITFDQVSFRYEDQ
ncbi:MAG: ABC transporter ATP-binding protein, partial [Cyanobacteria bacterium J06638_6]